MADSTTNGVPTAVAEHVVVVLDDVSAARPRPDLAAIAPLLTTRARDMAAQWSAGLTVAQVAARVSESAAIEAISTEHHGAGNARMWVEAVVTITAPGQPARRVPAPIVVDVIKSNGEWLVDGVEGA